MKRQNRTGNIVIGIMLDMVFWATIVFMLFSLGA